MNRLSAVLATAGAAAALVVPVVPASAAPTCADPVHLITGTWGFEAVVGTTKVKDVELALSVPRGCRVDDAVAVVTSPTRIYRVVLREQAENPDTQPSWRGSLKIDPKKLRNTDAGTWRVRYEVRGEAVDSADNVGHVRRATRVSFDAGPEPVRHGRITFTGTLERASWSAHRYRALDRTLTVQTFEADGVEHADLLALRTGSDGRFRSTVRFPGNGTYWAYFEGDDASGSATSRRDRVVEH